MTNRPSSIKILSGITLLAGLAFFMFTGTNNHNTNTTALKSKQVHAAVPAFKAEEVITSSKTVNDEPVYNEDSNPFEGQEVKARLQQVAEQFAEEILYPTFSKPIRNNVELIKYQPNRSVSSSMPINVEDSNAEAFEEGPRIALKTSKFRYYSGEPIFAEAQLSGLTSNSLVSLSANVMIDRKVIASALEISQIASAEDSNSHQYELRFDDLSKYSSGSLGDMNVVAEFKINGQSHFISSLIRYPKIVATLKHVGEAEVNEEYLKIPMHIQTSAPGIFSISGNLYASDTGTPLIHLNEIKELTSESGLIELRAHIVTLKKMGHEGPYELKDVSLSRGPSAPNFTLEQGLVPAESYDITGFAFSDYQDVSYVDERAQARLEFLMQLGSTN